MATVQELQEQKEEIERQLELAMQEERADAVKEARRLCKTFNITLTEMRSALKMRKRSSRKSKDSTDK